MSIEMLKNLNTDRLGLDEAVYLASLAGVMETSYAGFGVPAPDWLTSAIRTLDDDVRRRVRDQKEARLAKAKARRDALKTEAQKRADVEREIAELEADLGA